MDFKTDVLEESKKQPVLVDFWAQWCGPCRVLGPKLEKLAEEAGGKWKLVKINTEEFPEIAQEYRIMSIPNVKLFIDGEIVSEFAGAYPAHWILNWLDEFIPAEEELDLGELMLQFEGFEEVEKLKKIDSFLSQYPDNKEALILKAKMILIDKPDDIEPLLSSIKMEDTLYTTAEHFRNLARIFQVEIDPETTAGQYVIGFKNALTNNELEQAAQQLILLVLTDKNWNEELPRKAGIGFFYLIGLNHPVTKDYRRRFDMALY